MPCAASSSQRHLDLGVAGSKDPRKWLAVSRFGAAELVTCKRIGRTPQVALLSFGVRLVATPRGLRRNSPIADRTPHRVHPVHGSFQIAHCTSASSLTCRRNTDAPTCFGSAAQPRAEFATRLRPTLSPHDSGSNGRGRTAARTGLG